MKKSFVISLLNAASMLGGIGRSRSQADLIEYASNFAKRDVELWEKIYASASKGAHSAVAQRARVELQSLRPSSDGPALARRLAELEKDDPRLQSPSKETSDRAVKNTSSVNGSARTKLFSAGKPGKFGVFIQAETLKLSQEGPLWFRVPVRAGQSLIVSAAVEYKNIENAKNRKAVLLINGIDANGDEVDTPCGKLSRSSHLNAYFKYLPNTLNQVQEMHSFTVPHGVVEVRLGVCGFNQTEGEQVFVKDLSVQPKAEKTAAPIFVAPSAAAAEISILGWPDYPSNGKPYVMSIMDEFTTGCFEQEVNLIQPRPDNWYALAEKYRPEIIFIESAWKGNFGSWQYRVANYSNKPGNEVAHLCEYARKKGIPTLFWNKEDPVHHEKFMCSAKLVDHIFTTDANMKVSYTEKTGNPNVHALPFSAQPNLHRPAPLAGRKPRSCFAGSWYGDRHAERGQTMRWLLEAAHTHGLDIFDRNYGTGLFSFPEEYQDGIKGSLPYKELCHEYRRYRIFLNVNSVTESPTMFSRRVFELMACGTPIVSTYAKGIESLFESDAVWMVKSKEEADAAIHTLMTDDAEWRRRSLAGIREVYANHTYAHRLNYIFDRMGVETRLPTDPEVALLAEAHSEADLRALNEFAHQQRYRKFRLGVVCATEIASMPGKLSERIVILQPGQKEAWVKEPRNGHSVAGWITPNGSYGEHYLRDLVNATSYEPAACGWAKSLDADQFSYGGQSMLSAALWRIDEFADELVSMVPDARLARKDLYLIDSDQFSASLQQMNLA